MTESAEFTGRQHTKVSLVSKLHVLSVTVLVAAEAGVPGPPGGGAVLLAGETQRDAVTVHGLQETWL